MWNLKQLIAKFDGWCSQCKLPIKAGSSFIKDGQTSWCMNCARKDKENVNL